MMMQNITNLTAFVQDIAACSVIESTIDIALQPELPVPPICMFFPPKSTTTLAGFISLLYSILCLMVLANCKTHIFYNSSVNVIY